MRSNAASFVASLLICCAQAKDVKCRFELRVEDYTSNQADPYTNEYGVCKTVAGSWGAGGKLARARSVSFSPSNIAA